MNPEGQLKAIFAAVGDKWEPFVDFPCDSCDTMTEAYPSPTDMNELFRLAKKIDKHDINFFQALAEPCEFCEIASDHVIFVGQGAEPADALRDVLYKILKGEG